MSGRKDQKDLKLEYALSGISVADFLAVCESVEIEIEDADILEAVESAFSDVENVICSAFMKSEESLDLLIGNHRKLSKILDKNCEEAEKSEIKVVELAPRPHVKRRA